MSSEQSEQKISFTVYHFSTGVSPILNWTEFFFHAFLVFLFFKFFNLFFIEVQLNYNVPFAAVQQSDSFIHTYTFFLIFFFIIVYHRVLDIGPCAVQQDLVVYLYTPTCICSSQTPTPTLPLGNHQYILYVPIFVSASQINSFGSYFRFHI